jgi:hypothetical protein
MGADIQTVSVHKHKKITITKRIYAVLIGVIDNLGLKTTADRVAHCNSKILIKYKPQYKFR